MKLITSLDIRSSGVLLLAVWLSGSSAVLAAPGQASDSPAANSKTVAATQSVEGSKSPAAYLSEIKSVWVTQKTPQTVERTTQLLGEAEKLTKRGELDRALTKLQEAYGTSLETGFLEGQGQALTGMSWIYLDRGQTVKAKELGENAIEVLANSSNQRLLGKARVALAQAYFKLDNLTFAGQQLQLAIKAFTELGADDAPEAARAMSLAGDLLVKYGQVKQAFVFYQGAATFWSKAGDQYRAILSRIRLAGAMQEVGWLVAALEEANKSLVEARNLKDPDMLTAALATVGGAQLNLFEYPNALKSYGEALGVGVRYANELSRANFEAGLGTVLAATGELTLSKNMIKAALPVIKAKGTVLGHAQMLNILGVIETMRGEYQPAIQCYQEVLEESAIAQPKRERLTLIALTNLAAAESRSGNNRSAKGHLLSALSVFKPGVEPLMEGRIYSALGEVCLNLKDVQAADGYIKKGLEISQKIEDDGGIWRDYTNLARLQVAQQVPVGQVKDSLESACSFFRSPKSGAFASAEALIFPSTRESLGQQLVSLLVAEDMVEPALVASEQLKDERFIFDYFRHGGEVKSEDQEIYQDLMTQRAHLHAAEMYSTPDKYIKDWRNWLSRYRQLAADNKTLASLIAPIPISVDEIKKSLVGKGNTYIEYLVGKSSTIVFTLDSEGKLAAERLPVGRRELRPQIDSLLRASAKEGLPLVADRSVLKTLYRELVPASVEKVLPTDPDQTVVIIPDTILFDLPFQALIDSSGKFLVQRNTLTLAPSLNELAVVPPRYTDEFSMLLTMGKSANGQGPAYEARALGKLLPPDSLLLLSGKKADLENLQANASGKSVLHFTSPLPLGDGSVLNAVLHLDSDKDVKSATTTAGKLFALNLPSDLAVWSNTSVNSNDQGVSVNVFSRAFNYAGVRNLLMSLWVVPDAVRSAELCDFYKGEEEGLSQSQSLRKAQMIALSKDPSPRSWAAFQLVGPGH